MSKSRQSYLLIVGGLIIGDLAYAEVSIPIFRVGLAILAGACLASGIWMLAKHNSPAT
jgi:hypothetical protein